MCIGQRINNAKRLSQDKLLLIAKNCKTLMVLFAKLYPVPLCVLFFFSFPWLLTNWILSSCSHRKPPMAGRFLRQFHWLDWSILAKRRKSQFEEKNSGQIAVSSGRTQLYVCTTKPTFATNEQTLGGKHYAHDGQQCGQIYKDCLPKFETDRWPFCDHF